MTIKEEIVKKMKSKKLLDIPEVVDEINKHLWCESEKAGHDIGFDRAAEDWIERYSNDWMEHNMSIMEESKVLTKQRDPSKKRRAKSYCKDKNK